MTAAPFSPYAPTVPHDTSDGAEARDIAIHPGARVRLADPRGCRYEGDAITYDAARDVWLVAWQTGRGERVEEVAADKLLIVMDAESWRIQCEAEWEE